MTQQEFETTANELRPLMYDVGLRYFHSQDDAEDVAQESLLLLWKYCKKMDANRNIKALAVKVAKNCCISIKRKRASNPTLYHNTGEDNGGSVPATYFDRLESEEYEDLLEQMMQNTLSPRERELFELRRLDGLSNDEIEAETGVKKTTVQSMVSRARQKLFLEIKRRMNQ